jgi:hypothetical protein
VVELRVVDGGHGTLVARERVAARALLFSGPSGRSTNALQALAKASRPESRGKCTEACAMY